MKNKKRNLLFVLKVILLIEVVVLLALLVTVALIYEKTIFSVEFKDAEPQATTRLPKEEITEKEIIYEVIETEPVETIPTSTNDDFSLYTAEYELLKKFDRVQKEKTWIVTLTEEEFQDFCILVFAESGGEVEEGQVGVAATVINRILSSKFPDTFYGVINQPSQFSCIRNGCIISSITEFEELPETTVNAVKRALYGEDPTEEMLIAEAEKLGVDIEKYATGGALYFYNPYKCGARNFTVQIAIENHTFTKVWKR